VIEHVRQGENVVVAAVAGAGKTSLILQLHKALPELLDNTLTLCYNNRLEGDTQRAADAAGLSEPMAVFTYHSFAGFLSRKEVKDDDTFLQHLCHLGTSPLPFKAIFCDEQQDMRSFYCALILNIISRCNNPILVVLGDTNQHIMSFHINHPTSPLYLTEAPSIFPSERPWIYCALHESQRITPPIAALVNHCAKQYDPRKAIVSAKPADAPYEPVRLVRLNVFGHDLAPMVKQLVDKYGPSQVLLTAPSVKTNQCFINVMNTLSKQGVPFYMAGEAESFTGDKLAESENKVLVSSFHGSKGLTRRAVVILADGYMWNKGRYTTGFPHVVYVAMTRASDELILVQHNGREAMPMQCLGPSLKALQEIVRVEPHGKPMAMPPKEFRLAVNPLTGEPPTTLDLLEDTLPIMRLAEYLDDITCRKLMEATVTVKILVPAQPERVDMRHVTITTKKGRQENVSRLYTEAIPMYLQLQTQGHSAVIDAFTAPMHLVQTSREITSALLNRYGGRVMTEKKYESQLPKQYRMKAKYLYKAFQQRLAKYEVPPSSSTPLPPKECPTAAETVFLANCALALTSSQTKLRALENSYTEWADAAHLLYSTQKLRRLLTTKLAMNMNTARFKEYVGFTFLVNNQQLEPKEEEPRTRAILLHGFLDMCTTDVQIILRNSQNLSLEDMVTAALWDCTTLTRRTYLVNMFTGEVRHVHVTDKATFLHRLLSITIQRQAGSEVTLETLLVELQTLMKEFKVPLRTVDTEEEVESHVMDTYSDDEGDIGLASSTPPTGRPCMPFGRTSAPSVTACEPPAKRPCLAMPFGRA
jgi:hypothetical protein